MQRRVLECVHRRMQGAAFFLEADLLVSSA
jgi:hypothetical protein